MTLNYVLRMIGRGWAIIVATAVIGGVAATAYGLTLPPSYESTSSVAAVNQARVATFVQMVRTDSVLSPAARDLGQPGNAQSLATRISVTNPAGTGIVTVKGTASDPVEAARLTAAVVDSLMTQAAELERAGGGPKEPLVLVQQATMSTAPVGRSTTWFALAGAALGAILGLGLAVLWWLIGPTVKDQRDAQSLTGAPVIGSLPTPVVAGRGGRAAKRAIAVTEPISLEKNLRFLAVDNPQSYLVAEARSGAPADDTALITAVAFAEVGKRVLLIDADLKNRGLSILVQADQEPGLSDLLIGDATAESVIRRWGSTPVSVIPAGSAAPNAQELLATSQMGRLLSELLQSFDYVLLSSPPVSTLPSPIPAGVLLAVSPRRTTQAEVVAAVSACEDAKAPVSGVLLTAHRKSSLFARLATAWRLVRHFFTPTDRSSTS